MLEKEETGHKVKHMLDAGDEPRDGVKISYFLSEIPAEPITLTIVDAAGNEVESFTSDIPENEKDREGFYLTANEGMNRFQWSMNYPSGAKMVDTDFHGRPGGPLAMPGAYTVRLDVGDWSDTQSFSLVKDPRVTTSDEDLQEQFDLLMQIRDRLSEIAEGVNTCRSLTKQLSEWAGHLDDVDGGTDSAAAARALADALTGVEQELVQPEFTAPGDTLNYREKLFEKLGALPPVVSSADTRPTKQSHAVYDKLSGQADGPLGILASLIDEDLGALNTAVSGLGLGAIHA